MIPHQEIIEYRFMRKGIRFYTWSASGDKRSSMNKLHFVTLVVILLSSCAAPNVALRPEAMKVVVGKNDPTDIFSEVGPVSGYDGNGCGGFGHRGTYERAMIDIKNKASELGGDYVQLFTITEPHFRPGCFDNEYKLSGTAYKKVRETPSQTPIVKVNTDENQKSLSDKLRELLKLKEDGLLSEEEYQTQRNKILEQ
jgi:hypothetical protein